MNRLRIIYLTIRFYNGSFINIPKIIVFILFLFFRVRYLQVQWVEEQYNIFAFVLVKTDILKLPVYNGGTGKWWGWFVNSWHFRLLLLPVQNKSKKKWEIRQFTKFDGRLIQSDMRNDETTDVLSKRNRSEKKNTEHHTCSNEC